MVVEVLKLNSDDQSNCSNVEHNADGIAQDDGGQNSDDDVCDELEFEHLDYYDAIYNICPDCYKRFISTSSVVGSPLSVTKGCPFCPTDIFEHFGNLCGHSGKLERRVEKQGKEIVKYKAEKAFLRLNRPVDWRSDELLKMDGIVKIFVDNDDDPILAHKFILASKSSQLGWLLECATMVSKWPIQEIRKELIVLRIRSIRRAVMEAVIDFCYRAEISFAPDGCKITPEEVLIVARRYKIDYLTEVCDEKLATSINDSNLLDRMKVANLFDLPMTKAAVADKVKYDFDRCYSIIMGGYKKDIA